MAKLHLGSVYVAAGRFADPVEQSLALDLNRPPYRTEGFFMTFEGYMGAGKSNFLARFCEQLYANRIRFVFFDPTGGCMSLRALGKGIAGLGNIDHPSELRRADRKIDVAMFNADKVGTLVYEKGFSLVVDMAVQGHHDFDGEDQHRGHPLYAFITIMRALYQRAPYYPDDSVVVVIDELAFIAPQIREINLQKLSTDALKLITRDGRKNGLPILAAYQRSTDVHKSAISGANLRAFGRMNHFDDFKRANAHLGKDEYGKDIVSFAHVKSLETGQAYFTGKNTTLVHIAKRVTPDLGKTPEIRGFQGELPDVASFDIGTASPQNVQVRVMDLATEAASKVRYEDKVVKELQKEKQGEKSPTNGEWKQL